MSDSEVKVGRSKKSDKAKEKAGRPSTKHVRLKEALLAKTTIIAVIAIEPRKKK